MKRSNAARRRQREIARRRFNSSIEQLEPRLMLAGAPEVVEPSGQHFVYLLNMARTAPEQFAKLFPDLNLGDLEKQQPLAYNAELTRAAE